MNQADLEQLSKALSNITLWVIHTPFKIIGPFMSEREAERHEEELYERGGHLYSYVTVLVPPEEKC